ncbi:T9SS C-terminal target domain-containing protein [Pseudoxanthomonas sp. SGD-10]|nr:T9SS C-terminal target domain-containing protein [Pseudoxanthomonas sp. SGD-10]
MILFKIVIMKKNLLTTCLFTISMAAAAQPTPSTGTVAFTPGNLAIYRFNDNAGTSGLVPGFIDEIKPDGTLVRSIPMPVSAGVDGNRNFMAGLFGQGREGLMSLSADGRYLTVFGVEGPRGGTDYSNYPKVIGRISGNGDVNTSTAVPTTDVGNVGRQVTSNDGTGFYTVGSQGRVRYVPFGFNSGETNDALRSSFIVGGNGANFAVKIFNGKLYISEGSGSASALAGTVGKVSDELPTPSVDMDPAYDPSDFGLAGLLNPNDFVLLDRNNDGTPDLLYVIDVTTNANSVVRKYSYEELFPGGPGSWISLGSYSHAKLKDGKAMTGKIVGADVHLYIATAPSTGKPTIARINDPVNGTMNSPAYSVVQPATDFNASGIVTTILYGSTDYTFNGAKDGATVNFRGIAFAPEPFTTQPVKLTSFTGAPVADAIELRWTTASETGNSHFDIMRSDGKQPFTIIGTVKGKGTSSMVNKYSFTDKFPLTGTIYYQLKQVDLDGTVENSNVINVNYGINGKTITAYFISENEIQLGVHSKENSDGQVKLTDMNGRVIYSAKVALQDSNNMITLNPGSLAKGVYILSLTIGGESKSVKLLK